MEPKGAPKGTQNRTQNGSKSSTILNIEKVPLQDRLGGVLGRSWSVFGAIFESTNLEKPLVFLGFFQNSFFYKKCIARAVLDRTWSQFWCPRGPNGSPRGTQNGSKKRSKKCSKQDLIFEGPRAHPGLRAQPEEVAMSHFLGLGGNLKEGGNSSLTADPRTTRQPTC